MKLGRFGLHLLSDGEFRLDGGAMFGVVPKTLWEKVRPPDERNRIRMATNCLLVEAGAELVLVDCGIGAKMDAKFRDLYGMEEGAVRLPESLAAAGYQPEDVTHVVLSHLHFDHCGGGTRFDSAGRPVPVFPRARYWIERGELEHARRPSERDRASYFPENWEPLLEAGQAELFDDRAEVVPGIEAVKAPGHNADMCVVTLDGGGEHAIFLADLVPHAAHVPLPWIMGYDLYPLTTLEQKKLWLPRIVAGRWLCFFEHDPIEPVGRIVEEKPGRYRAEPIAAEEAIAAR
jgi:glyoxylase-like metal-dependent hydrolase (beta-lactamase superfamily II)